MTQQRLADAIGVAKRTLVGWEADKFAPNAEALVLMHAVGVDIQYVLVGMALPAELAPTYQLAARATANALSRELAVAFLDSLPASAQYERVSGPVAQVLNEREAVLLSNYRSAEADGKIAIERASEALAKSPRKES